MSKSIIIRQSDERRQRGLLVALLAAVITVAVGCRSGTDPERDMNPLERLGYRTFNAEQCFSHCHTYGAERGGDYDARDARAGLPPDLPKTPRRSPDWYRAYLVDPRAVLPQSSMPSFSYLSRHQLDGLVAFLEHQNKQNQQQPVVKLVRALAAPIPVTAKELPEYEAGRAIYFSNCRGCHGEWGNGGGPVGQLLVPEPRDFTDSFWMSKQTEAYLFSVISDGKPDSAMPAFKDLLDERERALVETREIGVAHQPHAGTERQNRGQSGHAHGHQRQSQFLYRGADPRLDGS